MRVIMDIPVQNIKTQRKAPMNLKTLRFAMSLLRGSLFPPIKVRKTRDGFEITDGRHRLAAYKLAQRQYIRAYVGITQAPDPHKPTACGGDKPIHVVKDTPAMERKTWLEL